ncbi:MAG: hypothetical protein VX899_06235 [Myxococcota bacterium]|nr:hypothetical protein [Myxococcota bacterium]
MDLSDHEFLAGVELADRTAVIAAHAPGQPADRPQTTVLTCDPSGQWSRVAALDHGTTSMARSPDGTQALFCDMYGRITAWSPQGRRRLDVHRPQPEMPLPTLRCVDGVLYALGLDHQVFARRSGRWRALHGPELQQGDGVRGFNHALRLRDGRLLCLGVQGALHAHGPQGWQALPRPTRLTLGCGIQEEERLVVGGKCGSIFLGSPAALTRLEHQTTDEDILGIARFGDLTCVSTPLEIFTLDGEGLELEVFADGQSVATVGPLFTGPSGIWSVGRRDVLRNDGEGWEIIGQNW